MSEREAAASHESIPLALLGWSAGCATIWASLFMVGNYLYGRTAAALVLGVVFLLSGSVLLWVVKHLWRKQS